MLLFYSFFYKHNRARVIYLLAVSLFFYFKTSGVFVLLLLFTICSDYNWGRLINNTTSVWRKKLFLTLSVCINLFLLCYFKYSYFFHESINSIAGGTAPFYNHFTAFSNHFFGTAFSVDKLLLPVGVSFFTFQSLSYTIDIYRGKVKPVTRIFDYGFFVSFFPHLVAGPIVKAHDFLYQIYQPYVLTSRDFGIAVFWIMNGFCKKIVADYLAVNFIDRVFDNPIFYSGLESVIAIFGYSLQIYMDFSGYTDMAIGIALLLGYRLKMNFNSPYKATSTSDFWKRWHISLSSWLKEYLYIPLGGNRTGSVGSYVALFVILLFLALLAGKLWLVGLSVILFVILASVAFVSAKFRNAVNTNINLMVTMLLGGLWHGSSWLFIIWGGLNGVGLIIHKFWSRISPFKGDESMFVKIILMLITLTFISFTRIFFRSPDMETVNLIFERITTDFNAELFPELLKEYRFIFFLLFAGYVIHWIPETTKENLRSYFSEMHRAVMGVIVTIIIFVMYQLMSGEMQPFIYFQF